MRKQYHLQGLACAGCAKKIEAAIRQREEVGGAVLNFSTSTVIVQFKEIMDEKEALILITKLVTDIEGHIKVTDPEIIEIEPEEKEVPWWKQWKNLRIGLGILVLPLAFLAEGILSIGLFLASYLFIGGAVLAQAMKNIRRGQIFDEYFLMSIATLGAFAIQEYPEAIAVMLFYQLGEFLQGKAVNQSRKSIKSLLDIRPDYANLLTHGQEVKVEAKVIKTDQIILVKPGERVPLDGKVISGESLIDTAALTGESVPRKVVAGDMVLSGSINTSGVLKVKVTKTFEESTASKIIELVENAGANKARTENFITTFSKYYTPIVVALAAVIALIPPMVIEGATFSQWIYRAAIFLVVSCPCALVVSIPLGFFAGIGKGSKQGILVKGGNYLEALNYVDTVIFDKTGTLTKGVFKVSKVVSVEGNKEEELLEHAAKAEVNSNHPIARSILDHYGKGIDTTKLAKYEEIAGHGIKAIYHDEEILAGNEKLMKKYNVKFEPQNEAGTIVHIAVNQQYKGHLLIADEIKEDSVKAIAGLKEIGIKQIVLLTGDQEEISQKIAAKLGIDQVHAQLLPQDKLTKLEEIMNGRTSQEKVIFVGDGINDAPVLARADIGVAMGGLGSDAAIEASDVVIMNDEPSKLVDALQIAKKTKRIVWQNIIWALGIKVLVLILGAFGIATMWEAVFADVGVTILAVLNAMRIQK